MGRRALKLAGGMVLGLLAMLALAFALAQTKPGKAWLAAALGRALSNADERVTLTHLAGLVPFDVTIDRIEIADAQGPRLTVDRAALVIAPGDLLRGRLTLKRLTADAVAVERPSRSSSGGMDVAALLHPPLAVSVEHAAIGRLALGPDMIGEPVAVTLAASFALGGGRAAADLDLRRIDGTSGEARLHLALAGAPPQLELAGEIEEPTGRLLADLLGQSQPLPLALHLAGKGPLADWHGTLAASAGTAAAIDAEFRIAGDTSHRFTATGTARIARLLPQRLQAMIGDRASFSTDLTIDGDTIALNDLAITVAAGKLAAHGRYDQGAKTITGEATLALPDLAALAPLAGSDAGGALTASLALGGTSTDLRARLTLAGDGLVLAGNRAGAAHATIDLRALGDPLAAATPVWIAASGDLGAVTPASGSLPAGLGDRLDWRLAARLDRRAERVDVDELVLADAGSTITAQATAERRRIAGEAHLAIPDIARFAGASTTGALTLDAVFRAAEDGTGTAVLSGAVHAPKSGTGALDRLLGEQATIAGTIERLADGTLSASEVSLEGAQLRFAGAGRRGGDGRISAEYRLALPRLAALAPDLAGSATVSGALSGTADALSATAALAAEAVTAGPAHLDRVDARLSIADLAKPAGRLEAKFRGKALDGTASIDGSWAEGDALRLTRVHLEAAKTRLDGRLTLHLASRTVDGTLTGEAADLQPWSALLGQPIGGSAQLKATLSAGKGQNADVTLDATGLNLGGASPASVRRLHATARLADVLGKPAGRGELQLDNARFGEASIDDFRLTGESDRPGRFTLGGDARGKIGQGFALTTSATMTLDRRGVELRLTRLSGDVGDQPVLLHQPLLLTRRGDAIAFADLDLGFGPGSITGAGSAKGNALSLHLLAKDLPVRGLAGLAGQQDVSGMLGFEATISGTRARPQGELVIDGEELRLAAASRPDLPPLGLVVAATWRGDMVEFKGRLAGPQSAAIGFSGAVPLVLERQRLVPHLPPGGALALHLEGEGELANVADMLPIGEDRLSGHFAIDVSVGGTVAAPLASGQLTLRDGRYESLVWGTVLTGVSFDLVGNRDRLVLQSFAAGDGGKGSVSLKGAVDLAAADGPALDFAGELAQFRAVQRDEATATVSGDVSLSGNIVAPRLGARLKIEQAELSVPQRLAGEVRPIPVTIVNGATGEVLATPEQKRQGTPLLAVALDVTVDMPGQVFVRGRGLDSEWRGRLRVTGTTPAPRIEGKLEVVRGTYDFLGKTATLSRGTITFLGGQRIDPEINIEARVRSTDVVAIVQITGTATQPSIRLASQPELPQDEILARVLFGTTASKISAAQGIEIAQAAAALASGGDPGVLDRIRRGLGLDRLALGSANANTPYGSVAMPTTPTGVPSIFPTAGAGSSAAPLGSAGGAGNTGATALSAGKYVAEGVYVGVTQGLGAGSSSVDVQIDVTRHISIDTTAGQATGTGVGLNWKLDY